jgi:hypothetical protein
MADDPKTTKDDDAKNERHEHVWQTFVTGDGSHAVEETRCSICLKVKKDA